MWRVLEKANVHRVLMGKSEDKSLIKGPKHVWVNNIKNDHLNMMGTLTGFIWLRKICDLL